MAGGVDGLADQVGSLIEAPQRIAELSEDSFERVRIFDPAAINARRQYLYHRLAELCEYRR